MSQIYNTSCEELIKEPWLKEENLTIVTDPPFNIGYKYDTYKDKKAESEYYVWLKGILTAIGCPFVVVQYPEAICRLSVELGKPPQEVCSWVYNSNNQRQHRDIAYWGVTPDFRKVTQPYKNPNDKRIKQLIANGKTGSRLYDWWEINQVKNVSKEKTEHPCQMPVEVMRRAIGILPDDSVIFDPFMGSGTTGVACNVLGRRFIGCEMDKKYFQIAKERLTC